MKMVSEKRRVTAFPLNRNRYFVGDGRHKTIIRGRCRVPVAASYFFTAIAAWTVLTAWKVREPPLQACRNHTRKPSQKHKS